MYVVTRIDMRLKILSWNIWCDGNFEKVSEFLAASKADIIGLQEVMPENKSYDVVSFLSKLGYEYAVAPIGVTLDDGRMITNGVFSKYPIRTSRMHTLSEESGRQAVEAEIQVGGIVLRVFSFHLKHTHQQESPLQNLQAENLIKVFPKEKVVVMGDYNATSDMKPIKRMREMLVDTDPSSKPTWSLYPEGCPICNPQKLDMRLDYIFVSKDLKTHSFKVEDSMASDHLPISVVLEL